ncbi:hypothetical protein [Methylotuvimicrobium alcaliphilum]|uniref:Uncharacterized protein n=1 Tax=Methylotuvimicrobium alcaliphilum (strain DSM 19304 / NCIMB 14124 / VKM B-2133 / 20Z) TaxID=1091494 RepID=G4SZH3_META2|nr:hypothetical protein [Methylotuvimicrobium alcaliphilum]CCE23313.1 conserved protein of unknown function [Methylotuvimicrobium alcaliphilum 20Z]
MTKNANLYDICDNPILKTESPSTPGQNLRLIYKKTIGHPALKYFILKGCRHPSINFEQIPIYQSMMQEAMQASTEQWQDKQWITSTFQPLAHLLDTIENRDWQIRDSSNPSQAKTSQIDCHVIIDACLQDIFRVWNQDKNDPWFPVGAQVQLSGDDHMDGKNLLDVLQGVGSYEYKNITLLFALIRCFLMPNPNRLKWFRKPYRGICEPMSARFSWIWHRIAFSDVNFFEHLLVFLESNAAHRQYNERLIPILENLLHYSLSTSREWLTTPNKHIRHPAITCLPVDAKGKQLCRLSDSSWQKKRDLGFGDYVPDTDTTFLALAMAKKWINFVQKENLQVDRSLLDECESMLAFPWVEIIAEYQVGGSYESNLPTIKLARPLDYDGAVPIWFEKAFTDTDGNIHREVLGNEICPGHNLDILDSILINRRQWHALTGENLIFLHKLLDFHFRAFVSDNFRHESAFIYYLPEIYTYYLGRFYQTYRTLSAEERQLFDPERKVETMREIALQYCKDDLIGQTLNVFDAALAVSTLVQLEYEPKQDGVISAGLKVINDHLGEGGNGHPFKAYEWNRMRHPTRILVGSEISTSLFVLRACSEAQSYLDSKACAFPESYPS